ncbi:MAG: hypothetical protein AB1428_15115 [Bacteroidota bacterium]
MKTGSADTKDLISAALVTDSELVIRNDRVAEVADWLATHGHPIVSWEGLIRSPGGKFTVSPEYSMRPSAGASALGPMVMEDVRRGLENAHGRFMHDHACDGCDLYFCIKLMEKTDLAYSRVSSPMRVLCALVGVVLVGIPMLVIVMELLVQGGISELGDEHLIFLLGSPLLGLAFLWTAIKGRGPGLLGDPNWSHRAVFRLGVRNPDGTRKWGLWK